MIWDSFFDDDTDDKQSGYSIWKKLPDDGSIYHPHPSEILFEGYLRKSESKSNSLPRRYFILTKEKLYYKKKQTAQNCKAYMLCKFMRVKNFLFDEIDQSRSQDRLRLRFVRNLKFSDLHADSTE